MKSDIKIDMIGKGRGHVIIPHKRMVNRKLSEVGVRQYFLEKIYEAGGPVEFDGDKYRLTDEIQVSQEFITQDVTVTWKIDPLRAPWLAVEKETKNG